MTANLTPGIRKRVWTTDPTATDVAELARDAHAAIGAVDEKVVIATFTNVVYAPPIYIDTGGRFPDAVVPGSAQGVGAPARSSFGGTSMLWDFTNGQVRILDASGLVVGHAYNLSFLLFFGGG